MPERPIIKILNESFAKSNKKDWCRVASQELNKKNPLENLTWEIDTLKFFPYYDQADVKTFGYLKKYQVPPHRLPYLDAGGWQNVPKITVTDEKKANAIALEYLATGADGILFDVSNIVNVHIGALLQKINWPFCNVSFLVPVDEKISTNISKYVDQQKYDPLKLTGSIFWKELPENFGAVLESLLFLKKFRSAGIIIPSSSPVKEISNLLGQGVLFMDLITRLGVEKETAFKSLSFSVFAEENFFMTIAKLKSIRLLWYQLSQAFEIPSYTPFDLHLHANSEKSIPEKFQPRGNMIRNTIQGLASVLGGCDALTLHAEDENNVTMNRVSLYVSHILKEESHLDKVADAVAGAYLIENMVSELAQAAWSDFQKSVSS